MSVRSFELKDLKAVRELAREQLLDERENFDRNIDPNWSFKHSEFEDALKNPELCSLVLEKDKKVIGFLIGGDWSNKQFNVRIAELRAIFVKEEFQRKGYGRELFNEFLLWCKKKGFDKMILETYKTNVKALNFYAKQGFNDYVVMLRRDV